MGDAGDGGLLDLRVLHEHRLDVAGVDVVAAPDDHVLLATDDIQVAVLVEAGEVAGVEPTVAPRLGRRFRVVEVLPLLARIGHQQFADLAGGQIAAVVVGNAKGDRRNGFADRTDTSGRLVWREDAVRRTGLGHSPVVGYPGRRHLLSQAAECLRCEWRTAEGHHLDARQVGWLEPRVDEQELGHRRDQEDRGRPAAFDLFQPDSGVESGQVEPGHPQLHGVVDGRDAGEGEERGGVEPAVAGPAGQPVGDGGDISVADDDTFGPAGCARRVHDVGHVVFGYGDLDGPAVGGAGVRPRHEVGWWRRDGGRDPSKQGQARAGLLQRGGRGCPAEGGDGFGVMQHVLELAGGQSGVGGHGDGAGFVDGGVGDDPLQRLLGGQVDRHPVTLGHPRFEQGSGQPVGLAIPFDKSDASVASYLDIGALVGEVLGHEPELIGEQLVD